MAEANRFQPPGNLRDFDHAADPESLRKSWHETMDRIVKSVAIGRAAFYHPLSPPVSDAPESASPEWTGLPRTIKRLVPASIADAALRVEKAVPMGAPDPMEGPRFTPPFFDASGDPFPGPAYRPQDEYLEWVTKKDAEGVITEVLFTCEGPEYWDHIAADRDLLLTLYKAVVGDDTIKIEDLLFPRRVTWQNPNGGSQVFEAGDYNPYNKWNLLAAVHLTQPANTLGAEIALAAQATELYGNPNPVTADPDLICCAAYGGINRMSDPTIGSAVNAQANLGNRVTLRNPIGLYMKVDGLAAAAFTLPDQANTPFAEAAQCFEMLRPEKADVTDMVLRARFRVPDGLTFNGKQLRVGDLKVNNEKIVAGGQVADVVTMTLFAEALPGAPAQERLRCRLSPCPDRTLEEFIHAIPFGSVCPPDGISPQGANLALADLSAGAAGPARARVSEAKAKFGLSRATGGGL